MALRHSGKCIDIALRGPSTRNLVAVRHPLLASIPRRCYATKTKVKEKEKEVVTNEEFLAEYEKMRHIAHKIQVDPWGVRVQTLDLIIPSLMSKKKDAALRDHWSSFKSTLRNWSLNILSMRRMAADKGFPGIKNTHPWHPQVLAVKSTKDSAWIAPIRKAALDTYLKLNSAVANRDEKTIKALAIGDMQSHYLNLARKQDPSRVYAWKFHGERSPCRVVSIRSLPGFLGQKVPNNGSRLLVQALVRFDTFQSLNVYSKKGVLLHEQTDPKPVVEYLVVQKRLWYDTPWAFRDRIYEGLEPRFKAL
ncbi:hypothetical protein WOLCODRAFT_139877 [Wolfiporia cocos MD-104 SS10]|uniref:Tim44-like domain-containing protein n=1 Tax=Wolfiporia cocos (strain MD-104) TaxID=742152 RepID=A0A2H3J6I6_WOLCO|nr:hypothetical protein WOLCODRAFT_139877 [Wolfiporia cocos MD-104 SS10]